MIQVFIFCASMNKTDSFLQKYKRAEEFQVSILPGFFLIFIPVFSFFPLLQQPQQAVILNSILGSHRGMVQYLQTFTNQIQSVQ